MIPCVFYRDWARSQPDCARPFARPRDRKSAAVGGAASVTEADGVRTRMPACA